MGKKKEIISKVSDQKQAATREVVAKQDNNRRIRDEVARDLKDAAQRRKEEIAVEQAKRNELIRQIRELEKLPIQRTKGFDPTETGGHGLMEEMSIAELRERLEFNKRKQEQEVNFKREVNLTKKEQEAEKLMAEAKAVEEARLKRKRANDAARRQKESDKF